MVTEPSSGERWDIVCGADRGEAESLAGALLAADTMARDQSRAAGALRAFRRTVYITLNGVFAGEATALARAGHLRPFSAEWGQQ